MTAGDEARGRHRARVANRVFSPPGYDSKIVPVATRKPGDPPFIPHIAPDVARSIQRALLEHERQMAKVGTLGISKMLADMTAQNREVSRGFADALRNFADVQASLATPKLSKMLGELLTQNAEITRGFAGALRIVSDARASFASTNLSKMLGDVAAQNRTFTRDLGARLRAIDVETKMVSDELLVGSTAAVHEEARRLANDVRDWYATLKPGQRRTVRGHVIGLILGACTLAMICSDGNTSAICLGIASYAYQVLLAWDAIQDILEDD
jgi:hypothetical protein